MQPASRKYWQACCKNCLQAHKRLCRLKSYTQSFSYLYASQSYRVFSYHLKKNERAYFFFTRIKVHYDAALACNLLSGCATAIHGLVSPMLDAGIESAVERNATPESMGVSTALYRGQDCASIKAQADSLAIEQKKPQQSALAAHAARRVLPTACCAVCATMPTSKATATSTNPWQTKPWPCSTWTRKVLT